MDLLRNVTRLSGDKTEKGLRRSTCSLVRSVPKYYGSIFTCLKKNGNNPLQYQIPTIAYDCSTEF